MKILFVHISFFTAPHSRHNQIMFMFSTNYRTIVNRLVIGSMTEILMEMGWCSQENWHSSVREGFQQTNKKRENNIPFQFSPEKVKEVTKGKNIFWKSPINGPEAKKKKKYSSTWGWAIVENHEVSHNMCNVSASETKHNRIYSEINLTTEIIIHSTNYYNYYNFWSLGLVPESNLWLSGFE